MVIKFIKHTSKLIFEIAFEKSSLSWLEKRKFKREIRQALLVAYNNTVANVPWITCLINDPGYLGRKNVREELLKIIDPVLFPSEKKLISEWKDHFGSKLFMPPVGEAKQVLYKLINNTQQELMKIPEVQNIIHIKDSTKAYKEISEINRKVSIISKQNIGEDEFFNSKNFWLSYLNNLARTFHHWHIPIELKDVFDWPSIPVPLDSYIVLGFRKQQSLLGNNDNKKPKKSVEKQNIQQTLLQALYRKKNSAILLFGGSGAGKSTCLRFLCNEISSKSINSSNEIIEIPIWIELRRYGPTRLIEMVLAELKQKGVNISWAELIEISQFVNIIFLFDGLDEVGMAYRDGVQNEIINLRKLFHNHKFILTSREYPKPFKIEDFDFYELELISDNAIEVFSHIYLGNEDKEFLAQTWQWPSDLLKVPLLLSLILIAYKNDKSSISSLANIYQKIVNIYQDLWEEHKKNQRVKNPLPWDIIQEALSFLAFNMINLEGLYSLTYDNALEILSPKVAELEKLKRWPIECTIDDLLNQLLMHNFINKKSNEISFWHSSFRDYFAALEIINYSKDILFDMAKDIKWLQTMAFVGGLLDNSKPIREAIIEIASSGKYISEIIRILSLIDNTEETTSDIIHCCSFTINYFETRIAYEICDSRNYPHLSLLNKFFELVFDFEDTGDDYYQVDWEYYFSVYNKGMLALKDNKISNANAAIDELNKYTYSSFPLTFDFWLENNKIDTMLDFRKRILSEDYAIEELVDFCRNTKYKSSIPFVEEIIFYTKNLRLKKEAQFALGSLKHL